ncbi:response regulator [Phenylobacterium sp.]|uniref:response regulator n=1 Tax=Phenylobacterium sp. TaxID=1871053 RepID=UPI00286E279E|nr:response regulator [Phenylobacterium sp.]
MSEAPEGQTGLSMIAENDYDLTLMDLRMPGMGGLTAIRHIRAREDAKAKLPVILVTADTGLNTREDRPSAGADDVILKPVAMNLLFDAIGRRMAADRDQSARLT